MAITEQTFEALALEDPHGGWELVCGELRQKPGMTAEHNIVMTYSGSQLLHQLDPAQFQVRLNIGHVRHQANSYYIPDVFVVPTRLVRQRLGTMALETYAEPSPLVIEVWSPSTGTFDVTTKLTEYQRRGDLEIWLLHPYERRLTAWRRQADGAYISTIYQGGTVSPVALPNVNIDLDALFDLGAAENL